MNKRDFLKGVILFFPAGRTFTALAGEAKPETKPDANPAPAAAAPASEAPSSLPEGYDPKAHYYGMGVDIDRCIGCNRCVEACKTENDVPDVPFYYRTWVERYTITRNGGEAHVETVGIRDRARGTPQAEAEVVRTFFVPKLCNHCAHPPCVQVCPVGATFSTVDGVVLVDSERCIGCRYCIQACPYGMRYLHPKTHTADKCTFCYHRVVRGLLPACVEVCPTQARIFGDLSSRASRLIRFMRQNKIHVLKPNLNTEPKVYYAQMDGEVR